MIFSAKIKGSNKSEGNVTLFIIDVKANGIELSQMETRTEKLCELELNNVIVPEQNILGEIHGGWDAVEEIFKMATVAKCCESVGLAQRTFDMAVDYAKGREQYGHPIATFQAIQHYAADMLVDIYGMRVSAYKAAWMISEGLHYDRDMAISRTWMLQATERIINLSHQIHGAIGITKDYDLHYFTRRLKASQLDYVDIKYYQDLLKH